MISAFGGKADICQVPLDVCFRPKAHIGQVAVLLTIFALVICRRWGRADGGLSKTTELLRRAHFQKVEHFFCRDRDAALYAFKNL